MARGSRKREIEGAAQSAPSSLVRMERDGKTADVHQDEVENWKRHGWRVITPARPAREAE